MCKAAVKGGFYLGLMLYLDNGLVLMSQRLEEIAKQGLICYIKN